MRRESILFIACNTLVAGCIFAESSGGSARLELEKTSVLRGESEVLRAQYVSERGKLEVARVDAGGGDAQPLASISIPKLGPGGFDFAVDPTGDVLWVLCQRNDFYRGGLAWVVYPLVPVSGEATGTYLQQTRRRGAGGPEEVVSLDLTQTLREFVIAKWQQGKPLSPGRGDADSRVNISTLDTGVAILSGDMGPKYTFSCKVGLDANGTVSVLSLEVEPKSTGPRPTK